MEHYFVIAWSEKRGWFLAEDENVFGDGALYDPEEAEHYTLDQTDEETRRRDAELVVELYEFLHKEK